jgi:hypothetical protein
VILWEAIDNLKLVPQISNRGVKNMSGIAKRKYVGELMRFNKSLKRPLKSIKEVLPKEYTPQIIIDEFKKYYPLIWKEMNERYKNYSEKDKFLKKQGKKIRYKPLNSEKYLLSLPQVKQWLSEGGRIAHRNKFNKEFQSERIKTLTNKMNNSVEKRTKKVSKNTEGVQNIEPLFVDVFISKYHKKGTTQEEKIEIFNELKKYNTDKTIDFFYKLNDAERNNQIRRKAFHHLQSLGRYVKLRKNFKGKKKEYMISKNIFDMTPQDLWMRIEKDGIQNKKRFDFFVSHSVVNRSQVLDVMKILNEKKCSAYCDWTSDNDFLKRELVSDYTKMVLKKRLDQSEKLILLKSKHSLESEWVRFELEYFNSLGKKIFFIDLDDSADDRLDTYKKLNYSKADKTILDFEEATK